MWFYGKLFMQFVCQVSASYAIFIVPQGSQILFDQTVDLILILLWGKIKSKTGT